MSSPGPGFSGSTDWERIRRRIEELRRAAGSAELPAEEVERLLLERARKLAEPPAPERTDAAEVLVFRIGDERYALPSGSLLEVIRLSGWSRLPGARAPLLGISGWRGELLTLYDLHAGLGLPPAAEEAEWALVVDDRPSPFGLPVTRVEDIVRIPAEELRDASGLDRAGSAMRAVGPGGVVLLDEAWLRTFYRNGRT